MGTIVHFFLLPLGQEEDQAGTEHSFNLAEEKFLQTQINNTVPQD